MATVRAIPLLLWIYSVIVPASSKGILHYNHRPLIIFGHKEKAPSKDTFSCYVVRKGTDLHLTYKAFSVWNSLNISLANEVSPPPYLSASTYSATLRIFKIFI